ncbi:MAG: hypothetical protein ACREDY_15280 [Bradyrhizobium sp.]
MKHLLTGVAIAAALAIAAPAFAQAPAPAGAPKAAAPMKPMKPMASKQRHHRTVRHHHMAMHHHGKMGAGDAMTEQLNREELARIQGGGMPPHPMEGPENAGAGQGGPRASGH